MRTNEREKTFLILYLQLSLNQKPFQNPKTNSYLIFENALFYFAHF